MHKLILLLLIIFANPSFALEFFQNASSGQSLDSALIIKNTFRLPELDHNFQKKTFLLKNVKLKGNSILTKPDFIKLIRPYISKPFKDEQYNSLKKAILKKYRELGYANVDLELMNKNADRGEIVVKVYETRITKVVITGNKSFPKEYFADQISPAVSGALNINRVNKALALLQSQPGINSVKAQLIPLANQQYKGLLIEVEEEKSYWGAIELNNHKSTYVGSENIELSLGKNNLTAAGDTISFNLTASSGSNSYMLSYELPLNLYNSKLGAYLLRAESSLVSTQLPKELKFLNETINDESLISGLNWQFTMPKSIKFMDSLLIGFETVSSKTSFGELSEYELGNKVIYSASTFTYANRKIKGILNYQVRYGFSLEQTGDHQKDDMKSYSALSFSNLTQVKFKRWNVNGRLKMQSQIAFSELSRMEKKSITGINGVRGYHENSMINESIAIINTEIQKSFGVKISGFGFIDYAAGQNTDGSQANQALSLGVGTQWQPVKKLQSNFVLGIPLISKNKKRNNLQDYGIHFATKYQF